MVVYVNRDDYTVISEERFDEIVNDAIQEKLEKDGELFEYDLISEYESPIDLYYDMCNLGIEKFKDDIHEDVVRTVKEVVLDELGDYWIMKEIGDGTF